MRKVLLTTTALVAFAGAAEAAQSPIQVTLGGSVDFRAALFHQPDSTNLSFSDRRSGDFQTEYNLVVAADGKAASGIEYGALVDLNNEGQTESALTMEQAYIWLSGSFGKVLMGDEHGATDLFVYAPTVGEGQIDGSYTRFVTGSLAPFQPNYLDMTENSTKITYYTPKVGNANHKVQLGVSYAPSDDNGADVSLLDSGVSYYKNTFEVAAQYTGNLNPVTVTISPMMVTAEGESTNRDARDYTAWGVGAQATYAGFTLGTAYVDAGKLITETGENEDQDVWNIGLKYGFDKAELAVNYMTGEGYQNVALGFPHVDDFEAIGFGATYTWFPGLTTAADAVFFDQDAAGTANDDDGHVLMLSQKMTF